MSFRLFVYWCALCGGWTAAAGWVLGRLVAGGDPLGSAGLKGLSLGLSIARQAAEYLGAELWAESKPGKGSTFLLQIPGQLPANK